MKLRTLRSVLCLILVVLLAVAALSGCKDKNVSSDANGGEEKSFSLKIVFSDGRTESETILTNEDTVGAALLAEGIIAGEESEWGLYVTSVGGEAADYDADGAYWAFYIDDEYAMTGVDSTPVDAGNSYSFVYTQENPETNDGAEYAYSFQLQVTFSDGRTESETILTNEETVGAALLEQGIIAGEESEWGLMVTVVDGETADYDADGAYWAFYINGEYAMTGIDSTPIDTDSDYALVYTKG